MLKVGLTGGIGSGKSSVAKIFEVLGIPVYYADDAARQIMNTDKELQTAIIESFGNAAYKEGKLDRAYIASIVFSDNKKLEILNYLTHPATIRHADEWMKKQTSPYAIKEAALLFESGASKHLDHIIGVYAPKELRIKRVMQRDNVSEEEVLKRLSKQMEEDEKMKMCDSIILNDEQQLVIPQVLKLHEKFLSMTGTIK
ncbi:MAG: dephospho-CoA kinase [Chitinophagaceae bacterium]|nr:dephospho-CoA kinase [Chitinophagaceae bacterium]